MDPFITLLIILGVALVLVVWLAVTFNGLVVARNQFKNAFSQIEFQLKRRHDLTPRLFEVAKGYMAHESETLERVVVARNGAQAAGREAAAHLGDAKAVEELNRA